MDSTLANGHCLALSSIGYRGSQNFVQTLKPHSSRALWFYFNRCVNPRRPRDRKKKLIGAYLIDLGRYDEAIAWLERAVTSQRYEPRHFPYFNLGRVYLAKGMFDRARKLFRQSLEIEPRYTLARQALESVRRMLN